MSLKNELEFFTFEKDSTGTEEVLNMWREDDYEVDVMSCQIVQCSQTKQSIWHVMGTRQKKPEPTFEEAVATAAVSDS